ncbi:hypothetical protein ACGFXC_17445 [Streptomyces sp. NPDC048507]|uniref:hypothetical protein n=1 Tax=Streptomyces sp. NPDC048507 TaxID=3365560 RepID=UPI003715B418
MTHTSDPYEKVFAPLRTAGIWDVQVPGYIDRDHAPAPRFAPLSSSVYLAVQDGGLLRLQSLGNHGQLSLHMVAEPALPPELDGTDEEFALGAWGDHYLGDSHEQSVSAARYALNAESDPTAGTVRCIEFQFEYGQRLFVDPGYHWGIRLQGAGAYEHWLVEQEQQAGPLGPVSTFLWTP